VKVTAGVPSMVRHGGNCGGIVARWRGAASAAQAMKDTARIIRFMRAGYNAK